MPENTGPIHPQPFLLVKERETLVQPWTLDRLGEKLEDVELLSRETHNDVRELRRFVVVDLAPRVTEVEKRPPTVASKAMGVTKWVGVATLALTILSQLAASLDRTKQYQGPIDNAIKIVQGLGQ